MAMVLSFPPAHGMHLLPFYPSLALQKCRASWSTMQRWRFAKNARKSWVANSSSNKKPGFISFGDQLLDYIEGGPKLRKWYGAPDQLPRDGIVGDEDTTGEPEQEDLPEVRDAVLVTDGDSEIGQMGALAEIENLKGIEHIIYLSQVTDAFKSKCADLMQQGLDEETSQSKLQDLKESFEILSSEEERRFYDWSIARSENPERYTWPYEVDITQRSSAPGPPRKEDDQGPTKKVAYFFLGWLVLSFILNITLK